MAVVITGLRGRLEVIHRGREGESILKRSKLTCRAPGFLGPRGFASGTYDSHSRTGRFLGKGRSSQIQNKAVEKFEARIVANCPGGTSESSPAFQHRVCGREGIRPGGTVDPPIRCGVSVVPPARAVSCRRHPPVELAGYCQRSLRDQLARLCRIYSTFQPLTSTDGFIAPNSLARYVAVISRFSPGSREM